MYKKGHIGISMIVFSPLAFLFATLNLESIGFFYLLVFMFLSYHPDFDMKVQYYTRFLRNKTVKRIVPLMEEFLDLTKHRGVTHTIWYAMFWGILVGIVSGLYSTSNTLYTSILEVDVVISILVGFLIGFVGILSHLIGDVITPAGISPFKPVRNDHYTYDIVRADNMIVNYSLLIVGSLVLISSYYVGNML